MGEDGLDTEPRTLDHLETHGLNKGPQALDPEPQKGHRTLPDTDPDGLQEEAPTLSHLGSEALGQRTLDPEEGVHSLNHTDQTSLKQGLQTLHNEPPTQTHPEPKDPNEEPLLLSHADTVDLLNHVIRITWDMRGRTSAQEAPRIRVRRNAHGGYTRLSSHYGGGVSGGSRGFAP